MKRTYEKERVAALSAGLAVIVLAWIAMQAFASDWIDSIGILSVWLYGPISAAAWGLLSAISYVLIIRAQGRNPALCPEHDEATRKARLAATGDLTKVPKCIQDADILELEKEKLAALDGRLRNHDCGMANGLIVCTPPVAGRHVAVDLLSRDDAGLVGFGGVYVLERPSRPPAPFVDRSH